jgi:hypothetical protein
LVILRPASSEGVLSDRTDRQAQDDILKRYSRYNEF